MAYVGTPIDTTNTFQSLTGDRFDGDGSAVAFTLSTAPASTLDIEVFVGNVRQDPNSAYTVSGTTLTFTGAPPSGTNNIYVVHQAKSVGTIDVPAINGSATTFSGGLTSSGAFNSVGIDDNGDATTMTIDTSENVNIGDATNRGFGPVQMGNASTAQAYLQMLSSTAGNIHFGDATSGDARFIGSIVYRHDTNLMKFQTNGATGLQIDSAGHVTKPKQPCFFVYADSQSGVGSGTTDIPFANERFDLNADFSTPSFTAPVTGKYAFQMSVRIVNCQAGGNGSVYFQVSNAEIRAWRQDTDGDAGVYETASASVVIDMDANDTCKLQVNSSSDSDFIIDGATHSTYFSGYLVA